MEQVIQRNSTLWKSGRLWKWKCDGLDFHLSVPCNILNHSAFRIQMKRKTEPLDVMIGSVLEWPKKYFWWSSKHYSLSRLRCRKRFLLNNELNWVGCIVLNVLILYCWMLKRLRLVTILHKSPALVPKIEHKLSWFAKSAISIGPKLIFCNTTLTVKSLQPPMIGWLLVEAMSPNTT